jgi:hypothetical protein
VARLAPLLLVAAALLLGGCGGASDEAARTTAAGATTAATSAECDDAAFRGQDEELYVTKTAVSNALAGGADPAALLADLRRAHKALGGYLAAHPPCSEALQSIASGEERALASLVDAASLLEERQDAAEQLRAARQALTDAESRLSSTG